MKKEYINYIFSKNPLSNRQLKRFYKSNNIETTITNLEEVKLSELKLSKWYLYTVTTSDISLIKIIKPYNFKNTIIVSYPDVTWSISMTIPNDNMWVSITIEDDFMWDFDLNYKTNENSIEFIEILEFTEEDIYSFAEYNNKYNKEG